MSNQVIVDVLRFDPSLGSEGVRCPASVVKSKYQSCAPASPKIVGTPTGLLHGSSTSRCSDEILKKLYCQNALKYRLACHARSQNSPKSVVRHFGKAEDLRHEGRRGFQKIGAQYSSDFVSALIVRKRPHQWRRFAQLVMTKSGLDSN